MKRLLVTALAFALMAGCNSQPPYVDNGNPGQIKAVFFYDDNRNGTQDSGESGAQVEAGISHDVSCPATSTDKTTIVMAGADGAALFKDLKPGRYCVVPWGNFSMTTKLTQVVYVSSDAITTVKFGIIKQ
ncbi:MAG TPA: SdrD B-like domain-containing protein [Anaerolineales bacterium]